MAVGWSRDGGVQEQIDASVEDAVKLARSRLPDGTGLTHCEVCETAIPDARRKAIPFLQPAKFFKSLIIRFRLPLAV